MRRSPDLSFLLATVFIDMLGLHRHARPSSTCSAFIDMLGLGLIVPMVPALMGAVTHDPAHAAAGPA
jgi:hypothetical protein